MGVPIERKRLVCHTEVLFQDEMVALRPDIKKKGRHPKATPVCVWRYKVFSLSYCHSETRWEPACFGNSATRLFFSSVTTTIP